jgi:hypothetical protein
MTLKLRQTCLSSKNIAVSSIKEYGGAEVQLQILLNSGLERSSKYLIII